MMHSFDVEVACEFGVSAAVLFQNLGFWVAKNQANGVNIHEGRAWTFNSRKAYCQLFPYLSERKIEIAFRKLIDAGLVVTGRFNKLGFDRTLWYSLSDLGYIRFGLVPFHEKGDSISQNGEMEDAPACNGSNVWVLAIPDKKQDIYPDKNTDSLSRKALDPVFDAFWQVYPKKTGKEAARKAFKKIPKSAHSLLVPAVEAQKKSRQWMEENGRFIPNPATWLNQGRWEDEIQATGVSYNYETKYETW